MRVLLLCDDKFHPGDIPAMGCEPLKEKGFTIDVIQNAADFDPAILPDYAVLIISKSDHTSHQDHSPWKTDAVQDAILKYVKRGGGLIAIHSGTAGTRSDTLSRITGCRFIHHPKSCPVTVAPLKPHPITEGVEMFCEPDEHYHLEILDDEIQILAAAYAPPQGDKAKYETDPHNNNPGGILPAVLVREEDWGNVCVITPGHTAEVWRNPNFQQLLINALNWCGYV